MVQKAKKIVEKMSKKPAKNIEKKQKLAGIITHYFDNISVAVLELKDSLKEGDNIRIVGGENTDFEQTVKSMETDHKKVKTAKKGKEVGLKIKEKAREGYKVFKV